MAVEYNGKKIAMKVAIENQTLKNKLLDAVKKGVITAEQYKKITGEEYAE